MINEPVVFLPGTLCDERVWLPVWRRLALAQRRYVPLQWASSKEEMLILTGDRILPDESVHLVGFSMGGYIASVFASANPKKVRSLTLIGYDAAGLGKDEEARRQQLVGFLRKGQFKPGSPAYLNRFIHPDFLASEEVAGTVCAMGEDLGANTLLAHTLATTPRENTLPSLQKAGFPIHIIAGEMDQVAPLDNLQTMASQLPNARLTVVPNVGHMMLLEQPEKLAASLFG